MFKRSNGILATALAIALAPFNDWTPGFRTVGQRRNPVQPPAPRPRVSFTARAGRPIRGPGEAARRLRQIQRGMLGISNGLHVPGVRYIGHGFAWLVNDGHEARLISVK